MLTHLGIPTQNKRFFYVESGGEYIYNAILLHTKGYQYVKAWLKQDPLNLDDTGLPYNYILEIVEIS